MTEALDGRDGAQPGVVHLVSLLRAFDSATLVTRARGGSLHGCPMTIARVDDNVTLWFITSARAANADEVAEDARAMVTLQGASGFICINGNAELVFDPERIRSLWKREYRAWYQSERDPDLVLVRFTSLDAEYWDAFGALGLKYVFDATRADSSRQGPGGAREVDDARESHAKRRLWDHDPKRV